MKMKYIDMKRRQKHIDKKIRRELQEAMYEQYPDYEKAAKQRAKDGLAEANDFCLDYAHAIHFYRVTHFFL